MLRYHFISVVSLKFSFYILDTLPYFFVALFYKMDELFDRRGFLKTDADPIKLQQYLELPCGSEDTIPKIESHYTRVNTSRVFIDGSKSIADIHNDYVVDQQKKK